MDLPTTSGRAAAVAGGQALRAATRVLATLRTSAKPLHPEGSVTTALLHRFGSTETSGAEWLDGQGDDQVLVRRSRAVGLPAPAPDVFGLALRAPGHDGRCADVLFATTGRGRLTRFTLTAGRTPYTRPLGTLLPYRTPTGPVMLSAVYRDEHTMELSWARLRGDWRPFATVQRLPESSDAPDAPVSFDPVLHPPPGLEVYDWVRRLRAPSYVAARRSRGAPTPS